MSFCSPSPVVQNFILSLAIFLPLELLPQGHKDEMDSPAMFPLYDSTTLPIIPLQSPAMADWN